MTIDRDILFYAASAVLESEYAERLVLLKPGTKEPVSTGYMDRIVDLSELRWRYRREARGACNLGLKLGEGLGVIDCDGPGMREKVAGLLGIDTSKGMISLNDNGPHIWVRTSLDRRIIRWRGYILDILAKGFAVIPPSLIAGGRVREWESGMWPMAQLPFLDASKVVEPTNVPTNQPNIPAPARLSSGSSEEEKLNYIRKIRPSVQGENGSKAVIDACLKILNLVDGDPVRAWPLALHYNRTRCDPPWDESEDAKPQDSLRRCFEKACRWWRPKK